jgi:hypothetical protein
MPKIANNPSANPILSLTLPSKKIRKKIDRLISENVK